MEPPAPAPAPAAASAGECRLVRVFGRVQGVGFRESCVQRAQALGVSGWVRNRGDGSVEAMLQGQKEALERMCEWLRQGPPAARVERIEVSLVPAPSPPLRGFERR